MSLLGVMVLFRKGHFILLRQSVDINSCRLGPSAIPPVPPPALSREHLWSCGAERDSGENSASPSAEATAPARRRLAGDQCSPLLGAGGREVLTIWAPPPCCLCSQTCEGGGQEWSQMAFVWGNHAGWPAQSSCHLGFVYSGEYHFVGKTPLFVYLLIFTYLFLIMINITLLSMFYSIALCS